MRYSYLSHLSCPKCQKIYTKEEVHHLCTCGSPLLVNYDLQKLKSDWTKEALDPTDHSLWRYHPFCL